MTGLVDDVVCDLSRILGASGVLRSSSETVHYERGYRYGNGRALAIVRPGAVDELQRVVRYCVEREIRMVPQGANTGLVGASTPDATGQQLVVSLERMRGVQTLDEHNRTACLFAGTRQSELNREAGKYGLFYPIDLGADPTLGGMIATNTGGSRLLRYGDAQRSLFGLEVVLADTDATLLTDLSGLRKDNSGIDLKQLFVGTSGAFGIIARVQVELQRIPRQTSAALVVPCTHAAIPALLTRLEAFAGEFLAAFEGMSANAMNAALRHNARLRNPFSPGANPEYVVLIELSTTMPTDVIDLSELLLGFLENAMQGRDALVADACVGRAEDFWALRHSISDGLRAEGTLIGFDISVPRSRLPALRAELIDALQNGYAQMRICDFGHCGDGGDHFNLVWPTECGPIDHQMVNEVRDLVYDRVVRTYGGSFSAEHGVGPHNIAYYKRFANASERKLAAGLKGLCDPKRLLGAVDFA
jgi:FAD/FMN-containing dehydrogenase